MATAQSAKLQYTAPTSANTVTLVIP
jgi:hypothetical protein